MENRNHKRRNIMFRPFLIFLAAGILTIALASFWWMHGMWQDIYETVSPREVPPPAGGEKIKERDSLPDVITVLLLGLDSRDRSPRADAIMVLSLHKSGEMSVVSVPRDMRVNIPGHGLDKINHAHAFGGVPLTLQTIENFLDVKMDYYITTDFNGFENIVDILGGVEIDVEKRMEYRGIDVIIDLYPGLQILDGDKALQYVRFRSDSEADFGRVRRQQELVKILAKEAFKPINLLKLPRILPEIAQNVRTDLELNQALLLAKKLRGLSLEEVNSITLPGRSGKIQGISYVIPQTDDIPGIVERYIYFNKTDVTTEQKTASV